MAQIKDELVRWNLRIIDLEQLIAEQKRRIASEQGEARSRLEVALQSMQQTLQSWRTHKRTLDRRL